MLTWQEIIGLSLFCWVFVGQEKFLFFLDFCLALDRWFWYRIFAMTGPDIYTADIFRLADLCIEAGFLPGLEDGHFVLLLRFEGAPQCEIRRAQVNCLLPRPCRVWLAKGKMTKLLGDSHSLPADLSSGVRPPYVG